MKLDKTVNARQHLSTNEVMLILLLLIQTFVYEGHEGSTSIWGFVTGAIFVFIAINSILKPHQLSSGYLLLIKRIFILFMLITFWGVINGIMHNYDSLDIIKDAMKYCFIFLIFFLVGDFKEKSKKVIVIFSIVVIYIPIVIYVLSVFVSLPALAYDSVHVDIGAQSIPTVLFCLSSAIFTNSGKKKYFLIMLIPLFSIIINGTRTYWLSIFIGFVVIMLLDYLSNRSRRLFQLIVIFILLTSTIVYFVYFVRHSDIVTERFSRSYDSVTEFNPESDLSMIARKDENNRIIASIDNLMFGEGLGKNIIIISEPYAAARHWIFIPTTWFHNAYLFFLLKLGIVGLLIFIFLLYLLFRLGFESWRNSEGFVRIISATFLSYLVSISVMSITTGNFESPRNLLLLAVLGSISISANLRMNENLESSIIQGEGGNELLHFNKHNLDMCAIKENPRDDFQKRKDDLD